MLASKLKISNRVSAILFNWNDFIDKKFKKKREELSFNEIF